MGVKVKGIDVETGSTTELVVEATNAEALAARVTDLEGQVADHEARIAVLEGQVLALDQQHQEHAQKPHP